MNEAGSSLGSLEWHWGCASSRKHGVNVLQGWRERPCREEVKALGLPSGIHLETGAPSARGGGCPSNPSPPDKACEPPEPSPAISLSIHPSHIQLPPCPGRGAVSLRAARLSLSPARHAPRPPPGAAIPRSRPRRSCCQGRGAAPRSDGVEAGTAGASAGMCRARRGPCVPCHPRWISGAVSSMER